MMQSTGRVLGKVCRSGRQSRKLQLFSDPQCKHHKSLVNRCQLPSGPANNNDNNIPLLLLLLLQQQILLPLDIITHQRWTFVSCCQVWLLQQWHAT